MYRGLSIGIYRLLGIRSAEAICRLQFIRITIAIESISTKARGEESLLGNC
jgi:hypothetical protein